MILCGDPLGPSLPPPSFTPAPAPLQWPWEVWALGLGPAGWGRPDVSSPCASPFWSGAGGTPSALLGPHPTCVPLWLYFPEGETETSGASRIPAVG